MQYKFFTIPVMGDGATAASDEMNAFIRGRRVLTVQRELISNGTMSCWTCCVEYIDGAKPLEFGKFGAKEKIDYRQVLNDEDFARFRILRECRKAIAEEDAVPAYAVFLDEHLANIAKSSEVTLETLKAVNGVGEKKIEKYGKRFIELWEKKQNEASGKSILQDSGN